MAVGTKMDEVRNLWNVCGPDVQCQNCKYSQRLSFSTSPELNWTYWYTKLNKYTHLFNREEWTQLLYKYSVLLLSSVYYIILKVFYNVAYMYFTNNIYLWLVNKASIFKLYRYMTTETCILEIPGCNLDCVTVCSNQWRLVPIFFFLARYPYNKMYIPSIHPSNGSTAQIGLWPPRLRFLNHTELDTR
jgi:hypothetical protein